MTAHEPNFDTLCGREGNPLCASKENFVSFRSTMWLSILYLLLILCAPANAQLPRTNPKSATLPKNPVRVLGTSNSISLASWTPLAELAASGNNAENFGDSVSVSGKVGVVGSDEDSSFTGAAYVFVQSSGARGNVPQTARLTASDGSPGDSFGKSVSISGNTIIVGAPGANNGQGKSYVFVEPPAGWTDMTETAQLAASDGQEGDSFGTSVSIDGQTAIIGAPDSTVGSNAFQGTTYVFVQPSGGWVNLTQTAELTASNGATEALLGFSVAISGNVVVAGAYGTAAVCIFVEPSGGWANMTQTAELGDSKQSRKSQLGYSVAIDGSTIVAGSPSGIAGEKRTGIAEVYVRKGSLWKSTSIPTATLTESNGNAGDRFGFSVATTGTTVLAGAPYRQCLGINCRQGVGPGYVLAFAEPTSGWTDSNETESLYAADGESGGFFGASVAASGPAVLVGATGTNTAYVFQYASNSMFNALIVPGASFTTAQGINDLGQIVVDTDIGSFLYANGVFTPIVYPGAAGT